MQPTRNIAKMAATLPDVSCVVSIFLSHFTISLQFDYDALVEERLPDDWDYKQFWSSYQSFFLERGYTLYNIDTIDEYFRVCIPPLPREHAENLPHPYACFSVDPTKLQCVEVPLVGRSPMFH